MGGLKPKIDRCSAQANTNVSCRSTMILRRVQWARFLSYGERAKNEVPRDMLSHPGRRNLSECKHVS